MGLFSKMLTPEKPPKLEKEKLSSEQAISQEEKFLLEKVKQFSKPGENAPACLAECLVESTKFLVASGRVPKHETMEKIMNQK